MRAPGVPDCHLLDADGIRVLNGNRLAHPSEAIGPLEKVEGGGNIVERWAKRCLSAGASDPARGDLGKFLSDLWAEELSRQSVAQRGGPTRSE
jgi:hypothetical protein